MVVRKRPLLASVKVVLVLTVTLSAIVILDGPSSPHEELVEPLQYQHVAPPSLPFITDEMKSMTIPRAETWDDLQEEHPTPGDPSLSSASPRTPSLGHTNNEHNITNLTGLHNYSTEQELRRTLQELLAVLSTPTYHCRKLIIMGGLYCDRKPDGEKYVCHDPGLAPPDQYCLVYSVGVGHDLSFDLQMDRFGCEVFAFDSDFYHRNYPTFIGSRLTFYKVRMGTYFLKELQYQGDDKTAEPYLVEYWPLPAVMARLGHVHHQLHYLKLDIEGAEWDVLEETVFKTDILEGTQQLSIEVHLEDLREGRASSQDHNSLLASAAKYLRILRGLQARGFHLAYWEPNYRGSELTTHAGLMFHVFSETLWVNPGYHRRRNWPVKGKMPEKL